MRVTKGHVAPISFFYEDTDEDETDWSWAFIYKRIYHGRCRNDPCTCRPKKKIPPGIEMLLRMEAAK